MSVDPPGRSRSFLFVCDGNTCRSPLAEEVARSLGVEAASAGVTALAGSAATPQAVAVAEALGLDIRDHRSRLLTRSDVEDAANIYTMTQSQADWIVDRWPTSAGKVSRLDPERDIADPLGGSLDRYEAVATQIRAAVNLRLRGG